jgi:hypothetical protein
VLDVLNREFVGWLIQPQVMANLVMFVLRMA